MRVRVEIEPYDVRRFCQFAIGEARIRSQPTWWPWLVLLGLGVGAIWISSRPYLREQLLDASRYFVVFLGLLFVALAVYVRWRPSPFDDQSLIGPSTYSIEASGFWAHSSAGHTLIHWNAIQYIADDPDYIFVLIGEGRGFVIPKRAFPSEGEADAFLIGLRTAAPGAA